MPSLRPQQNHCRWQEDPLLEAKIGPLHSNKYWHLGPTMQALSPLVLTPTMGTITPQFQVISDDLFTTVSSSTDEMSCQTSTLPDGPSQLFRDSGCLPMIPVRPECPKSHECTG
jgi:hypothetical protein